MSIDLPAGVLTVTSAGDGPPLVMLHGISSQATAWAPVAAALARSNRLFMVDQRGHGASMHPERGYLLADYADDLTALLDALELERPLLMGHSLGGMVILEWAQRFPDRAAAMVIEDSPMRRGGEGVEELFDGWIEVASMTADEATAHYAELYPDRDPAELRARAENITSVAPGVFSELKADMLAQGGAIVIDSYAAIASPTLLVYGDLEQGGMVPASDARHFEQVVSNSRIAHIPGGGHSLHNDLPEPFLEIVLPFLKEHAAGASRIRTGTNQ